MGSIPPWTGDPDPYDVQLDDGIGLIVRTDFRDEEKWKAFLEVVKRAEEEGNAPEVDEDEQMQNDDEDDSSGSEEESSGDEEMEPDASQQTNTRMDISNSVAVPPASVFHIINPLRPSPLATRLNEASNLSLLRVLCDLEIVPAPKKPEPKSDEYFVAPKKEKKEDQEGVGNRLVNKFGWKEVYRGEYYSPATEVYELMMMRGLPRQGDLGV